MKTIGTLLSVLLAVAIVGTAQAELIAFWEFNGGNFLTDSSGNGHNLIVTGTAAQVNDAASFDGLGYLTSDTIDLTPYRQVTISWDVRAVAQSTIIYEQSASYNGRVGALLGKTDMASMKCAGAGYNLDNYVMETGVWAHYEVVYDLDAESAAGVVQIFDGSGDIIGTATGNLASAPSSFYSDVFNLGARAGFAGAEFTGELDNFKISAAIPEPATFSMFGLAVAILIGIRRLSI